MGSAGTPQPLILQREHHNLQSLIHEAKFTSILRKKRHPVAQIWFLYTLDPIMPRASTKPASSPGIQRPKRAKSGGGSDPGSGTTRLPSRLSAIRAISCPWASKTAEM